jgi:hypothetical protein
MRAGLITRGAEAPSHGAGRVGCFAELGRRPRAGENVRMDEKKRPIIFVSCGQVTDEEKQLGRAIGELINSSTPFRAYFAENQVDFDGLTNHIFRNLHHAQGFVGVMHERGHVLGLDGEERVRASVWIEQELAIAAFLRHILQKPMHVALFKKREVALEGVREKLILNPIEFVAEAEVIEQLKNILPTWTPFETKPTYSVSYRYSRRVTKLEMRLHEYSLTFDVVNDGETRATDYRLEVDFPTAYLYDTDKATGYRKFVFDQAQFREGNRILYPGESREAFKIDYYVDDRNFNPTLLRRSVVHMVLYSGDQAPKHENIAMADLHEF